MMTDTSRPIRRTTMIANPATAVVVVSDSFVAVGTGRVVGTEVDEAELVVVPASSVAV